ncbi:hypothetical protein [Stenotrophomonas sp. G106K1]|uniref:hypothetical protein n=1 Tax=Stenotrophomonas sp. G106K1 TaxID=3134792 RepID=UPI0030F37BED
MIELLDLQQTLHAFAACNDDDEVYASFGWLHAAFCAGGDAGSAPSTGDQG